MTPVGGVAHVGGAASARDQVGGRVGAGAGRGRGVGERAAARERVRGGLEGIDHRALAHLRAAEPADGGHAGGDPFAHRREVQLLSRRRPPSPARGRTCRRAGRWCRRSPCRPSRAPRTARCRVRARARVPRTALITLVPKSPSPAKRSSSPSDVRLLLGGVEEALDPGASVYHVSATVRTGASQSASVSASMRTSVTEQPPMSSASGRCRPALVPSTPRARPTVARHLGEDHVQLQPVRGTEPVDDHENLVALPDSQSVRERFDELTRQRVRPARTAAGRSRAPHGSRRRTRSRRRPARTTGAPRPDARRARAPAPATASRRRRAAPRPPAPPATPRARPRRRRASRPRSPPRSRAARARGRPRSRSPGRRRRPPARPRSRPRPPALPPSPR